MRILLVQLGSTGDCLLVTPLLRQIKLFDYPNSHITWMICSPYKYIVENNPYLDDIIEIPLLDYKDLQTHRNKIDEYVKGLIYHNKFEKIFITDYYSKNHHNWYCTTRSSLFRSYPHRIKVDIKPDLFLTEIEKTRALNFCNINKIDSSLFNILIESSPRSGQSSMNHDKAIYIAELLTSKYQNINCIISSSNKLSYKTDKIIDGSELTFRETKELLSKCNLVIGASSAISWMTLSSDSLFKVKMVQIISRNYEMNIVSASLIKDFKYFGLSTNNIIELIDPSDRHLIHCLDLILTKGFKKAKKKFGVNQNFYLFGKQVLLESYMNYYDKIFNAFYMLLFKIHKEIVQKQYK